MNLEKLKPWNWFKHENQAQQVPVTQKQSEQLPQAQSQSAGLSSLWQLHQEMDKLFNQVWQNFGLTSPFLNQVPNVFDNTTTPWVNHFKAKLDISADNEKYEVSLELPGLTKDDIQLEVADGVLTISGEKVSENKADDSKQYYSVERSYGSFTRTLNLPEDVDIDKLSANLKDGVLTILLPRVETERKEVKRISITSH